MPSTIDATGATDVSAALNSWLNGLANGATALFRAGGVYKVTTGIMISGRTGLTVDGNGSTLRSSGSSGANSLITVWRSTGTTIRNFTLVGDSPTPGVYSPSGEQAHGIRIYGGRDTDISGVTISAVWGHGVLVSDASVGVHFHDSHVASAGVMGFAVMTGRDVVVERVRFDKIGYGLFDIEPDFASDVIANVTFRNNTAGVISQELGKRFFFGANGASGSSISNVTVTGNTISGSPLDTYVTVARRSTIVFTNNTSSVTVAGPVLHFAHVDGLTVTGNVQPLSSGALASISDCTGVTYP